MQTQTSDTSPKRLRILGDDEIEADAIARIQTFYNTQHRSFRRLHGDRGRCRFCRCRRRALRSRPASRGSCLNGPQHL